MQIWIREAIALVFSKFAEFHSVRQVLLWLRQESIALPSTHYGAQGRSVVWKLPIYNTVLHILTNPVYAGAYVFGRTETRVRIEQGRKRVLRGFRRPREHWQVLITEHHEGYISWDTYEHNQRVIADNANMKGEMVRGALRRGEALLAGLLRCGHCGRKLHVVYTGSDGNTSRYHCRGANINHGAAGKCISFGSLRIDQAVGAEVLRLLKPLGIEAALAAIEQRAAQDDAKRRQARWSDTVEQIRGSVLELTYTAWDLEPFAHDVGYDGPPFRWDPERRFLLRCELDAAFFHLYGLSRDDTDYVMDTFPIVRKDDKKAHGEYRTKRVILEIYDAMAEAARTGKPYQTRLDPPPADPRVAHPVTRPAAEKKAKG